jgi:transposase InsO family protein
MRDLGLKGEVRGRGVRTTWSDPTAANPLDRVNRNFTAERPNQLWVADFTFVSTWQGFAYVAFIVDVYSRFIVGWRVSRNMKTDFVLDALEQALYARQPEKSGLIHHSDRGSQYVSIRYSERLMQAGVEPSVGSTPATATTMHWRRRSTAFTKRSWFARKGPGRSSRRWSGRLLIGCIGLTKHVCLNPSVIFHRQSLRHYTNVVSRNA